MAPSLRCLAPTHVYMGPWSGCSGDQGAVSAHTDRILLSFLVLLWSTPLWGLSPCAGSFTTLSGFNACLRGFLQSVCSRPTNYESGGFGESTQVLPLRSLCSLARCTEHRVAGKVCAYLQQMRLSAAQTEVSHDVSEEDRRHMRQALDLAKRGQGKTYPNPAVGCVIVKGSKVGPSEAAV